MYKMTKFGLIVLASCVLAACGSSGGGDNHSSTTTTTNITPTKTINTTNTISNTKTGTTSLIIAIDDQNGIVVKHQTLTTAGINQITVNGKTLVLEQPGIYVGTWTTMRSGDTALYKCCGKYSDVRFGAYEGGPNGDAYFFYNGNPTKSMPQSGTATYTGHSIISPNDEKFDKYGDYILGTSTFNADFAAKTLNGTLNINDLQPVSVKATISNNDFQGTATSKDFSDKANVEGKFYGTNAKELGGIYEGKTWGGAFGASK